MKIKVEIEGTIYRVEIKDPNANPVLAEVNGKTYAVWAEKEESKAQPVEQPPTPAKPVSAPPAPANVAATIGDPLTVTAPLPGVIVSIEVHPGQAVRPGEVLCTLEAMKMKNAIRASREGTIAEVQISVGDQVKHGQPLFRYQD